MGNHIKRHFDKSKHTMYVPRFPEKYRGSPQIICRSSWEEAFCKWADYSPAVVKWCSEEIEVKYHDPMKPTDKKGRPHFRKYYPDFIIETTTGKIILIEVKPYKETIPPTRTSKKAQKTMITEQKTWKTNQAKWNAARNFCKRQGWEFKILTEKELFGGKRR